MSDGTLRLFGLLLALLQPARATLIAVEEPEVSIHVAALEALVGVMRSESSSGQIVLTTHSADLLDFVDVAELRLVRSEDGKTVVSGLAEYSKKAIRDELFSLGELHRIGGIRAKNEDLSA
jgi:type I restriction enzyme M protein